MTEPLSMKKGRASLPFSLFLLCFSSCCFCHPGHGTGLPLRIRFPAGGSTSHPLLDGRSRSGPPQRVRARGGSRATQADRPYRAVLPAEWPPLPSAIRHRRRIHTAAPMRSSRCPETAPPRRSHSRTAPPSPPHDTDSLADKKHGNSLHTFSSSGAPGAGAVDPPAPARSLQFPMPHTGDGIPLGASAYLYFSTVFVLVKIFLVFFTKTEQI